jgi:arylsulfatase A-like enzyme
MAAAVATPDVTPDGGQSHNIVVIVADDVGVDLIGAYEEFYPGHPDPAYENTTPAIDYLAAKGLLFRNAWATPACSATRAQLLTGKHGYRSGIGRVVRRNPPGPGIGLDLFHDTIPSMLRASASPVYHTAAVGKWHLADGTQQPPPVGEPIHPLGDDSNPWFHQYAGAMYNLPMGYNGWTKTFATAIDPATDECVPLPGEACDAHVDTYATVDTADGAIHLVRTVPEPFFLQVAFNAAHVPLDEPEVPLEPASCIHGQLVTQPVCDFSGDAASQTRCMVQWMDNEIGRLLCAIEDDPDQPERPTTIIFMGDSGTSSEAIVPPFDPNHGKDSVYEGGVNVPFVVKSRFIKPSLSGTSTEALVNTSDVFATVADIAQVAQPADPLDLRDSISFRPVLQGFDGRRDFAYTEFFLDNFVPEPDGTPPADYDLRAHRRAVRNREGFKLIQVVHRDGQGGGVFSEQLFDLVSDPHEQENRINDAMNSVEPYASNYDELRATLDIDYPSLVRP